MDLSFPALWKAAAAALRPLPPVLSAGQPSFTDWLDPGAPNTRPGNLIRTGYEANSAVFACAQVLQRAFPEPALRWYDRPAGLPRRTALPPTHPLVALTTRPNPLMGEDEWQAFLITYAALGGNGHLYKVRAKSGQVGELWPYHAGELWAVPGPTTWVAFYAYQLADGQIREIPPADVVHWKWAVHPRLPWVGLAPLAVVLREVLTDSELTRFLQALLVNDAIPRGILQVPNTLSDAQFKRVKDDWALQHAGGNRGKVGVLENGTTYQRMALNLSELAFTEQRAVPERRIAGALGMSPQIAGLGSDPTYSNYEQAELAFTRRTLVPLWKGLESELTAKLGSEFGGAVAEFDLNDVAALAGVQTAARQFAVTAYTAGLLQRDEARIALGHLPVGGEAGTAFYAPRAAAPAGAGPDGGRA